MNTEDKYIGMKLDDRYEIHEVIGEGGMAVVYRARDLRLDRDVAVKIMRDEMAADEEFRQRFCAESHAIAMLSQQNIVAVYDVSHSDAMEYIVMELVDGITLRQYMEKKGVLKWQEAVHFSRQMCRALSHAHERGIIHRDIKPQNIMLLRDGTIKVGDFGIAALENELNENSGQAIGSIHYIAPEQVRGECPDARSDIYSLGVVMYEMLTGRQPHTGDTLGEIAVKHMNAEPQPPHELVPEIPEELERIVLKAMSTELNARYQSAAELLEALEGFVQNQTKAEAEQAPAENVQPVKKKKDTSKRKYIEQRRRAARVSYMTGTLGVLLTAVALFVFIWNFWLEEIFAAAERIELPNFVGTSYSAVTGNPELAGMYNFKVTFVVDPSLEPGIVIDQSPNQGRSMMVTPNGIDVELTVSAAEASAIVPNVVNYSCWDAISTLLQQGFRVEIQNTASDTFARDLVISTSPNANEEVGAGTTVYIVVSCGEEISMLDVPNVVGLSEEAAVAQLRSMGFIYGGAERTASDLDAGTVIGQSIEAHTQAEEHSSIILTVSAGPQS